MLKLKIMSSKFFLAATFFTLFVLAGNAFADTQTFFVEPEFDLLKRDQLSAVLIKTSPKMYWYAESDWLAGLNSLERGSVNIAIDKLDREFTNTIYPRLTMQFGSEWKPGIDGDERITVLLHRMRQDAGGYWVSSDEYDRLQIPRSNQREMVYLDANQVTQPLMKSFLAHEFMHLIIFNQKERRFGIEEEVWLNEGMAEMGPAFLGYDDEYKGSNLERRVRDFLRTPNDSLTEWENTSFDYGTANLFVRYIADRLGWDFIADLLQVPDVGIKGINSALANDNSALDFAELFTDWTVTLALRKCSLGQRYCYLDKNLQDLWVLPSLYNLPNEGDVSVSVSIKAKDWAGNWYRFIGGHGDLELNFTSPEEVGIRVPYLLEREADGTLELRELDFDDGSSASLTIENFNKKFSSLTLIPSIQHGFSSAAGPQPSYELSWSISLSGEKKSLAGPPAAEPSESPTPEQLLQKIAELKAMIADLQAKIAVLQGRKISSVSCASFETNLFYGMQGPQVRCLQEFLKNQGPEIYPEGLVTGNFLELTRAAVIRFQEKYASEILAPLGLSEGTGFVGPFTRTKIKDLLK